MKKIFIIYLMFVICISLFANPVSKSDIKKVANNFLQIKDKADFTINIQQPLTDSKNNTLAYIYQLNPTGFLVITADDILPPVISYSFTNKLIISTDNLIYEMLIKDINLRLNHTPKKIIKVNKIKWKNYLTDIKENRDYQQWPAEGCTDTDGWVEKRWNQTGVFNRFCPLDGPYSRSVVGCVATAMSMIIDFHHYVGNVQFSDADDYTSGWNDQMHIDDDHEARDYPSFPELNQYLITLKNHYDNDIPLTDDDKSALCFAAGISTHMIYGAEGSGTWVSEVQTALLNKFGFSSADYEENINQQFYQLLAYNMKSMQPAELAIYTSGWNNGHAIICDGYNTDNYFHLNYGWGSSDNTCWYSLPEGMPAGYSIIDNAVVNIEGGEVPTVLSGTVNMPSGTPEGTYIRFEGDKIYEAYVTSNDGHYEIPAIEPGSYTATAIKEGSNLYYASYQVNISGETQILNFDMATYNALTVHISSSINPVGTHIIIYKDDEPAYQGVCDDTQGILSIPNVLPGNYFATASLGDNYFDSRSFEVTQGNQELFVDLQNYFGNLNVGYHTYTEDKWHLISNYTISCGIKLTESEISLHQNDPLANVSFIAPISSEEGEISIQLWENNTLIEEKQISDFSEGEWLTQHFDNFHFLNPEKIYYVGYKIISSNGYIAYYDKGPQLENKGAYLHTASWNMVPTSSLNKSFCIEAGFISQHFATITGNISTSDNYTQLEKGIVSTNNFITKSDNQGNYTLYITPGTYDITAFLPEHSSQTINDINAPENNTISDINFFLEYGTENSENGIIPTNDTTITAYPNPYVAQKSSKQKIVFKLTGNYKNSTISIFNIKGQLVKILNNYENDKVYWNISNKNGKKICSGIYLYRLINSNKIIKTDKIIIIK